MRLTQYIFILFMVLFPQYAMGEEIGSVTVVQNQASVFHKGIADAILVKKGAGVLFEDTYQTQKKSKVQILFRDDTVLNIAEKSTIQITEHFYNPSKGIRKGALRLLDGTIRALVGKLFAGMGSQFEIHTPTAVAAARGTYFIVSVDMVNNLPVTTLIALGGTVDVFNKDPDIVGTVHLAQGFYTTVQGGKPPSPPTPTPGRLLSKMMASTESDDERGSTPDTNLMLTSGLLPNPDDLSGAGGGAIQIIGRQENGIVADTTFNDEVWNPPANPFLFQEPIQPDLVSQIPLPVGVTIIPTLP